MEHFLNSWQDSWAALEKRIANKDAGGPQQHWQVDLSLLVYGNLFYFCMLVFLAFWMKDRDAYNPKAFMKIYNACDASHCLVTQRRA